MMRFSVVALAVLVCTPAGATRALQVSLPTLYERAEVVLDVSVDADSTSSFWVDGRIYTRRTAAVLAVWKGVANTRTVSIVTLGGVVGGIGQRVDGEAVVVERGVVFLKYMPALDGYRVLALSQGFVPVMSDAEAQTIRASAHAY